MKKYKEIYLAEFAKLEKYCDEIAAEITIADGGLEYLAIIEPGARLDMFGEQERGKILIQVATESKVKVTGELDMNAQRLKKIIRLVEKAAAAFFVAERERAISCDEETET